MRCSERRGWSRVQSGRLAPAVAELGSFCGVLALIASGLAAGCRACPRVVESPFAADAECLQLFWMFTLDEVPADADLTPPGPLDAPRVECIRAASVDELFSSIHACPGTSNFFCPALVSEPGARAAVALDAIDNAGASARSSPSPRPDGSTPKG
jgi:hypothetical protein